MVKKEKNIEKSKEFWLLILFQLNLAYLQPVTVLISTGGERSSRLDVIRYSFLSDDITHWPNTKYHKENWMLQNTNFTSTWNEGLYVQWLTHSSSSSSISGSSDTHWHSSNSHHPWMDHQTLTETAQTVTIHEWVITDTYWHSSNSHHPWMDHHRHLLAQLKQSPSMNGSS